MALNETHRSKLIIKYGITPEAPSLKEIIERGLLASIDKKEVCRLLGRDDLDSGGMLIQYPNVPSFTIRLDTPLQTKEDKPIKYLRPAGQLNRLYLPLGESLDAPELWITEGELKALSASLRGLSVVALPGIWNWRTSPEDVELYGDNQVPDSDSLIADLSRTWNKQRIRLIYDSDINPAHSGFSAFQRLGEQLYRLGADEVKIITLPPLLVGGKTGLDDFIKEREREGKDPVSELKMLMARASIYLPSGDGAEAFAEQIIKQHPEDPEVQVKATASLLAAKGEVFCRGWLKKKIKGTELQKAVLREANQRLPQKVIHRPKQQPINKDILSNPVYVEILPRIASAPRYRIDRIGNLCSVKFTKQGGEELTPIANFVPFIKKQIIQDNGVETTTNFEIGGVLAGGRVLPKVQVPAEKFLGMNWVVPHWGAAANLEPGQNTKDKVRHAVQQMAGDIPSETVYTHLGWRKLNVNWIYLHAAGAIGAQNIQIETDSRLVRYRLPANVSDLEKGVKSSLALLKVAPQRITIPLLSITYLSILCEALRQAGIEPGFLMWLFGMTGSMKSTLAALFLSHFGDFDAKSLPASFRDTAAGLEKRTFAAKDVLFVVDDYCPASDPYESRKKEQSAQLLLRAYGDRVGRGRMRADTSLRPDYPPRGMALATGEDLPQGQSSTARLFVVEVGRNDVDIAKLSAAQAEKNHLSCAMRGFIEWLAPQLESFTEELKDKFQQLRIAAQAEGQHLRLPEVVAWLYIGLTVFLDFAKSIGAIEPELQAQLAQEGWKVLTLIADEQAARVQSEQPAQKFLNLLRELFMQKLVYVRNTDGQLPLEAESLGWDVSIFDGMETYLPGKAAAFIGWTDKQFLYLLPEGTYKEIVRFSQSQGGVFPVKQQTLWKNLDAEGMLFVDRDRDRVYRTVRKTITGQSRRVLQLNMASLFE